MFDKGVLIATSALALCLLACGPTPDQVNNSGHEPYLNGDYATALNAYEGAQGRAPEYGEPHYNVGNALYRMEEYGEALRGYDESLRYGESGLRSRGFFNRGNASFQTQQYVQAIEAYKEVLRMNPDDLDAKHNLELALAQLPPQQQDDQQQDERQQDDQQQDDQQQEDQQQDERHQDERQQDERQQDDQQQDDQQQDERQQDERQQDERQQDERQQDDQQQDDQQTVPITKDQARQILETVGEDAQTLQERRRQVLVSPNPPSEFDW